MKVLMVGANNPGTGYDVAFQNYCLAMDSVDIDVAVLPISMNGHPHQYKEQLKQLTEKPSEGCDIIIQHTLPHLFEYNGHYKKNIGLFAWETSCFPESNWINHINLLDEVWVINHQMKSSLLRQGVTIPIKVVPHTFSISEYQRKLPKSPSLLSKLREDFTFYVVTEAIKRKNLAATIRAFHSEFAPDEPVNMVFKISRPGLSADQTFQYMSELLDKVKSGMKLYKNIDDYKVNLIVSDRLSNEELLAVHNTCDAYVSSSYGEAWDQSCFTAAAIGKPVIAPRSTGYIEYLSDDNSWLVDTNEVPVFGVDDSPPYLYCSRETWWEPSILKLRKAMRECYENESLRESKSAAAMNDVTKFDYQVVGNKIKEILGEE